MKIPMKGIRSYGIVILCLITLSGTDCTAQIDMDSTIWEMMMTPDEMPVRNGRLIVLPGKGLFITEGTTFYSLDKERCPNTEKFRILEKFPFEQVIINDGLFLVKYKEFVLCIGEERTEIVAEFDTEDFVIIRGHDSIFNIVLQEDSNQYAWYKYDIRHSDAECIMRQNVPMNIVDGGKNIDYCIVGNSICMVSKDGVKELVNSQISIIDAVVSPLGLMFCTDSMLYLYINENVVPIAEGAFYSLYNDNDVLYAVMENGMIYKSNIIMEAK